MPSPNCTFNICPTNEMMQWTLQTIADISLWLDSFCQACQGESTQCICEWPWLLQNMAWWSSTHKCLDQKKPTGCQCHRLGVYVHSSSWVHSCSFMVVAPWTARILARWDKGLGNSIQVSSADISQGSWSLECSVCPCLMPIGQPSERGKFCNIPWL